MPNSDLVSFVVFLGTALNLVRMTSLTAASTSNALGRSAPRLATSPMRSNVSRRMKMRPLGACGDLDSEMLSGERPLIVSNAISAAATRTVLKPRQEVGLVSNTCTESRSPASILGVIRCMEQAHGRRCAWHSFVKKLSSGAQFNGNIFGMSFGLKNHFSFGLRFPTLRKC